MSYNRTSCPGGLTPASGTYSEARRNLAGGAYPSYPYLLAVNDLHVVVRGDRL